MYGDMIKSNIMQSFSIQKSTLHILGCNKLTNRSDDSQQLEIFPSTHKML
jgi:hypothetical protein